MKILDGKHLSDGFCSDSDNVWLEVYCVSAAVCLCHWWWNVTVLSIVVTVRHRRQHRISKQLMPLRHHATSATSCHTAMIPKVTVKIIVIVRVSICAVGCLLLREQFCTVLSNMSSLVNFSHATFTIHYAVHFISRVLQSLLNPAIWLHHRPLHGVVSVRLQILLEGMFQLCRWQQSQEGDWARPHLVMWCDVCFRKCLSPNTAEILGWSGWSNRSFVMLFVTLSVPNILSNIAQ